MIKFINKYIFLGSEKNPNAPYIFLILLFYLFASTSYYVMTFGTNEISLRLISSIAIVVGFVIIERSRLSADAVAFISPFFNIANLTLVAVSFGGDFLIFTYAMGCALISFTYMKPRAVLYYILATAGFQAIFLVGLGHNMLGQNFSVAQNYVSFLTMIGINVIIYIFCAQYTRMSRAKGDFLSNMSHEIRTPMNAIIGMTTIGNAAEDLTQAKYALSKIENASTHLLALLNDILDMSKIESGKFELHIEDFSLDDTLDWVNNVISVKAAEKKQIFEMDIDRTIHHTLRGDSQRLTQVLTNLLGNASKFTPEGGKIQLNARQIDQEGDTSVILFEVIDTGIGIRQEELKYLFTEFHQAERDTTRKYGGTGLGLSIVKSIVEMMNGRVWVESKYGSGSKFSFIVHLCRVDTTIKKEVAQPTEKITFPGKHLLLVEDVDINREIATILLEPTELTITLAEDGLEAVGKFAQNPQSYDMIFMDVQMPNMDGFQATAEIRKMDVPNAKTIPIVALTANVFREDIEKCLAAGMNGHLGKPLDIKEVLAMLQENL